VGVSIRHSFDCFRVSCDPGREAEKLLREDMRVYARGGECAGGGLLYDGRCILAGVKEVNSN
jgi:hypothetical protein